MRKAIIAAIVATALFAVGAFAAEFTVQSEDVASGADTVDTCLQNVDIEFEDPVLVSGTWVVDEATATFTDEDPSTPVTACDTFNVDLAVERTGLSTIIIPNVNPSNGIATFPLGGSVDVATIIRASVAADNDFLPPAAP